MTLRRNIQRLLPLACFALVPLASVAQDARAAGVSDLDARESAIRNGIASWRRVLTEQPGGRGAGLDLRPRRGGNAVALPGDARGLLGEISRQIGSWQDMAATVKQWENEQASYLDRGGELVGRAQACAVERRNRRTMLAALEELSQTLAHWPEAWQQFQNDKLQRLDRVAQLIDVPTTYATGIGELKSWQDEFQADPVLLPPAVGSPDATTLFAALVHRLDEVLAEAEAGVSPDDGVPKSGQAALLVQAAEAYPREQRERRQLQTAMDEIGGLTKQWSDAEWREISHDSQQVRKLLALVPVQASYLSRNRRGEALAEFKSDIENFEYFELPKAMSLRQASADPLVYGDSDEWLRLSEANPEVAAEPDAELAAGTLLVVPRKPIGQP